MALTKAKLLSHMQTRVLISKEKTSETLEVLLEIMKKALESGEELMISGFGRFNVREKGSRSGRNPATGDPMVLRARRVVTFKTSRKLAEKLNPPNED